MKSTLGKKVFGNRASPDIRLWQLVIDYLSTHSDIKIIANVWFGTFPKTSSDFENPGFPYFPVMDRLLQRVLHTKRAFAWHQLFARPASSTTMCFDLIHRQWWWWWWSYIWCAMLSIVLWDWQTTKRKTTKNIHPTTCPLDKWREEGSATHQRQGVIANTYIKRLKSSNS